MTGCATDADPAGRDPETRAALSCAGAFAVRRRRLGPRGFAGLLAARRERGCWWCCNKCSLACVYAVNAVDAVSSPGPINHPYTRYRRCHQSCQLYLLFVYAVFLNSEEEASRNPFSLVRVSRRSGPPPPPPGLYTEPEKTTGPLTAEEKAAEERKIAYIQPQEALASQDKKKDKGPTAQIDNSVFLVGTGVAVALSLLVVVATIAMDGGL